METTVLEQQLKKEKKSILREGFYARAQRPETAEVFWEHISTNAHYSVGGMGVCEGQSISCCVCLVCYLAFHATEFACCPADNRKRRRLNG